MNRYIAYATKLVESGGNDVLALVAGRGFVDALPAELSSLIRYLSRWRTPEEHLAAIQSTPLGQGFQARDLADRMNELRERGYLLSDGEFFDSLRHREDEQPSSAQVNTIVWHSADRVPLLQRSIESAIASCAREGRTLRLLVMDDSRDPAAWANTVAVIESLKEQAVAAGMSLDYCGADQKRRLKDHLLSEASNHSIDPEVVRFAWSNPYDFSFAAGSNRNLSLLLTAGEAFCSTDDDTVFEFSQRQGSAAEPEISSASLPVQHDFFADWKKLDQQFQTQSTDITAIHEQLLGKSVTAIISTAQNAESVVIDRLAQPLTFSLLNHGGSVAATLLGVHGEAGTWTPRILFQLDEQSRERLMADKRRYLDASRSHLVQRSVTRPTITDSNFFISVSIGVDNRALVPFFAPFGRPEDAVFATLLRCCVPTGLVGHLPESIRHAPPIERRYAEDALVSFEPRIDEFMIRIAQSYTQPELLVDPVVRFENLGRHLEFLGSLSLDDFNDAVRSIWAEETGRYLEYLAYSLHRYDHSPRFWAHDVERHIESVLEYTKRPGPLIPVDLGNAVGTNEAPTAFQRSVRAYGSLLRVWPALHEIMRNYNQNLSNHPGQSFVRKIA